MRLKNKNKKGEAETILRQSKSELKTWWIRVQELWHTFRGDNRLRRSKEAYRNRTQQLIQKDRTLPKRSWTNQSTTANPVRSDHALTCGKTNGKGELTRTVRESRHIQLQSPHTHAHTLTQTRKMESIGHWMLLPQTPPHKKGQNTRL